MNDLTTYELPNYVQASSLDRLKDKIRKAGESLLQSDLPKGLVVSSPSKRRPTAVRLTSLRKHATSALHTKAQDISSPARTTSGNDSRNLEEEEEEDSAFRDSVLHCMFKSLGLEQAAVQTHSVATSLETSPRLTPVETTRNARSTIGSALRNMAIFDQGHPGSESENESVFTSNSLDGIENEIDNDLEIIHFGKNAVLVEAQERNPGLYYVIDGFLDVGIISSQQPLVRVKRDLPHPHGDVDDNPFEKEFQDADDGFQSLYLVKPGGIAGYQAGIGNYRSFVDVRAKTDVIVGFLPRGSLERIMEKKPVVLLTMAKRLISLLSPLILHLDFALEWLQVSGGQTIYRKPCHAEKDDANSLRSRGRF